MARKWFREEEGPAVFLAIGIDDQGEGFMKVSEVARRSLWDIELSIDERLGLIRLASVYGWRLDEPLW